MLTKEQADFVKQSLLKMVELSMDEASMYGWNAAIEAVRTLTEFEKGVTYPSD